MPLHLKLCVEPDEVDTDYLFRQLAESVTGYAVLLLDTAGNILSWNDGAQRIKGYTHDEIVGLHFSRFYTDDDIADGKPARALEIAARTGSYEEIGPRVRKDGTRFIANTTITALRNSHGMLEGFGRITSDITELTAADESIRSSESRLKSLVDTVLDTIVDGVITFDKGGEIQSCNKASVGLFGYTADELAGKNVRILLEPSYRDEHDCDLDNYLRSGTAKFIGIGHEVMGRRQDGRIFPMDMAVGATSQGGDHAFVGIVRNITDRHDAEKGREQLRQAQKMEAIGQLTGGIAHDFNNLLAVIIGNLDLLVEEIKPSDRAMSFVMPSIDAALRGSELTKQLLAFGRKQALLPKMVSINDLLEHFTVLAERIAGERITVAAFPAADLWSVFVDPGQIEDALLNLTVNARDAMPNGGKLIFETQNVTIDEHYAAWYSDLEPGDYAMLAVSDTGLGMAEEIVAQAFEPFFSTKGVGKGSGLGLSMVYGFVKQSAGHIKIYSEVGHGTSVKIYLPRADGVVVAPPADEIVGIAVQARDDRSVLVVEDNPNVLELTVGMVTSLGFTAITAVDADEAVRILAQRPGIDLLLTDVMLPGTMNGPALALRAVEMQPQIKILFNSGYATQAIFDRGLLALGVNLISKPFRKQQLAAKINEVLKR